MLLTDDELRELTGRRHRDAQRAELDHLGIAYRVRRDGSIIVLRSAVEPAEAGTIAQPEPELLP